MRRRFKLKAFITLVVVFALGILLPLILHASTDDNARAVKLHMSQIMVAVFYLLNIITSTVSLLSQVKNVFV